MHRDHAPMHRGPPDADGVTTVGIQHPVSGSHARGREHAAAQRTARLTADTIALNDAVVIDGSMPTPHST